MVGRERPNLEEQERRPRALRRADRLSSRHNLLLLAINVVATAVAYASLEVAYVPPANPSPSSTCDGGGAYEISITLPMCAVNLGLTLLSWLVLCRYYSHKYTSQCRVALLPREPVEGARAPPPPFWRGHMLRSFVFEALVLGVQPAPWLPAAWYELAALAVAARAYLGVRALRDYAKERTHAMCEDAAAGSTQMLPPPLSWRVALKLLYSQRPVSCLAGVFVWSFFTLAFAMHVAERDCNVVFEDCARCARAYSRTSPPYPPTLSLSRSSRRASTHTNDHGRCIGLRARSQTATRAG